MGVLGGISKAFKETGSIESEAEKQLQTKVISLFMTCF
jgi:hypothetical protein